jgi:hypothetical protein
MEMIQGEETPRLGVSEGMRIRIRPIPFLGQPKRVMERIQREETLLLGVFEGIRLRISKKNPPESFPRTTRKGHGNDTKGRNLPVGGF